MSEFEWQPEASRQIDLKPLSSTVLRNFGIKREGIRFVSDLEELKEYPPNIIIAKAMKDLNFMQNNFKTQQLKKKNNYVMGLGVYQQLTSNKNAKVKMLKPAAIKFRNIYNPYRGQNISGKSLIVFRTGGIGDLLFIQPNLRYLKELYPDCTIKFACGPQYQAMVETWDCIDVLLDLPFELKDLTSCDYHVLFEGVIERCKLAESVNSYNLFSRWMGLDLPDDLLLPKQAPKEDKVTFCKEKLHEWGVEPGNFFITQLKASSPIRTPRPKFWADVINEATSRGHKVLITDNPRQADHIDEFIKIFINDENKDKVFNFCKHSLSLDYSIALTSLCGCVIATDSALNHIAASLGVKCFGVYGPFPGYIRMKTYPKCSWIDAKKECAPCFMHGSDPCPKAGKDKFSPCYDSIDTKEVVDKVEDLIND